MSNTCHIGSANSAGSTVFIVGDSTATSTRIPYPDNSGSPKHYLRNKRRQEKKIDAAVYSYIQAIRALDRTTITPYEISTALELPCWRITASLKRLQDRGIKINRIC